MKQINYFKFCEKYPEFIDIDDTNSVKLVLLKAIKKKYWFKKEGEIAKLLPIKCSDDIDINIYKDILKDTKYCRVKYKNANIVAMWYNNNDSSTETLFNGKGIKSYVWRYQPNVFTIMEKEEIINLKREILINDMLK